VTNADAAMRWLGRNPPNHEEVRAALTRIQGEGHRTSEVFESIRALFQTGDRGRRNLSRPHGAFNGKAPYETLREKL
jgi:hypothetical protein